MAGGGFTPIIIDRIQDRTGHTVFRRDQRECARLQRRMAAAKRPPSLPDARQQVLDPVTAYQIVSMTEGVVQRGTATTVNALGFPLGGKTGTTNDYKDAWFIGFRPTSWSACGLASIQPRDMGEGETGGAHRGADLPRLHARGAARHAADAVPYSRPACGWCASTT